MAGDLDVTVRLDPGGTLFARRFDRFVSDLTDLSPAFDQMAEEFYDWEEQAFDSAGASAGAGWRPLSPRYASWKAKNYPGRGVLERELNLRRSLTGPSGPRAVHSIGSRRMEIGTEVPYAVFHQEGTGRMPARPVIRLTEANKMRWTRILHRHLVKSAAARFEGPL